MREVCNSVPCDISRVEHATRMLEGILRTVESRIQERHQTSAVEENKEDLFHYQKALQSLTKSIRDECKSNYLNAKKSVHRDQIGYLFTALQHSLRIESKTLRFQTKTALNILHEEDKEEEIINETPIKLDKSERLFHCENLNLNMKKIEKMEIEVNHSILSTSASQVQYLISILLSLAFITSSFQISSEIIFQYRDDATFIQSVTDMD
ncbi:hypothetical protein CRE_02859 [Caenorhabditis remanei]|uniref:Uncharacterized protein n=1 Tax=Caenorhabditis remanei TaxID=31234 RepID=E3LWA0_CAERE|nr:hypothetical protein CRE_02859 [Caenorhabditis remanei]